MEEKAIMELAKQVAEIANLVNQQAKDMNNNMDMMIKLARNIAVHKQIIMDIVKKVGIEPETFKKVEELNEPDTC